MAGAGAEDRVGVAPAAARPPGARRGALLGAPRGASLGAPLGARPAAVPGAVLGAPGALSGAPRGPPGAPRSASGGEPPAPAWEATWRRRRRSRRSNADRSALGSGADDLDGDVKCMYTYSRVVVVCLDVFVLPTLPALHGCLLTCRCHCYNNSLINPLSPLCLGDVIVTMRKRGGK